MYPYEDDLLIGFKMTAEEAMRLEAELGTAADEVQHRIRLMACYYFTHLNSAVQRTQDSPLLEDCKRHLLWLIEHHPEIYILTGFSHVVDFPPRALDPRFHEVWMSHLAAESCSPLAVERAIEFFRMLDPDLSNRLREHWMASNTPSHDDLLDYARSSLAIARRNKDADLAKSVLDELKYLSVEATGETRFHALSQSCVELYLLGDLEKAAIVAKEALSRSSERLLPHHLYMHSLHIILGLAAIRTGNVAVAGDELLQAGNFGDEPVLQTYGPDMLLAAKLMEQHQISSVLSYLSECKRFWKTGLNDGRLDSWIESIKDGGIPDFGRNLNILGNPYSVES